MSDTKWTKGPVKVFGKPMVIVCDCGGYHAKADCPKRWEEFNQWFAEGLRRNHNDNQVDASTVVD